MIVRKRLAKLLQGPLRRRVGSDVLVENSSCPQFHNHEYIQSAKGVRYHDEEVARHDHLGMVMDERQPTLFGIGCAPRAAALQVLLHRARRNPDPEFELQLVGDAFLAPGRILHAHLPDQDLKTLGQERSPRRFRLPTPKEPEAFAVPPDECIRLDIHQRIRPLEHLTQSRHQPASGIVGSSGFGLSLLEESQLLAQK